MKTGAPFYTPFYTPMNAFSVQTRPDVSAKRETLRIYFLENT
jgi:hypothetical protein